MFKPLPIRMTCAQCGARYNVRPDALKPGRKLSCRRCGSPLKESRHREGQPVSEDVIVSWLCDPRREDDV